MDGHRLAAEFESDGYAVVSDVLEPLVCETVAAELADIGGPGARNLLDADRCLEVVRSLKAHPEVKALLPPAAVAVQCSLFQKSSEQNWLVALHQDTVIPVRDKVPGDELVGWSEKDGLLFVQAPVDVLDSLVAVRVCLDDCDVDAGPLRVIPGSHRGGRLSPPELDVVRTRRAAVDCVARRGDAVMMRPLLVHGSSKMRRSAPRRILHVVYGNPELPHGLRWRHAV